MNMHAASRQDEIEEVRQIRIGGNYIAALAERREFTEADFAAVYGKRGSAQFWENYLFDVKHISEFIHWFGALASTDYNSLDLTRAAVARAMLAAHRSGEQWFGGAHHQLTDINYGREISKCNNITVMPRPAVEWMARSPTWRRLIPPTLEAYLAGRRPAPALATATDEEIDGAIRASYDEAIRLGAKPPNLREIDAPVGARLKAAGLAATRDCIQSRARQPEFQGLRRAPGRVPKRA
jgi:hypothetical protein